MDSETRTEIEQLKKRLSDLEGLSSVMKIQIGDDVEAVSVIKVFADQLGGVFRYGTPEDGVADQSPNATKMIDEAGFKAPFIGYYVVQSDGSNAFVAGYAK